VNDFGNHNGEVRHFVHKRLFRAATGFIGGGVSGAAKGFFKKSRRNGGVRGKGGLSAARIRLNAKRARQQGSKFRRRSFGPALPTFPIGRGPGPVAAGPPGGTGCPQGYHPNKSDYMTKSGFVAKHSKCVRNRRRNLSNGRANTRSLRRMAAWDKQERKLGKTLKAIARGR